jgi:hypothetical protein
MYYKIGLLIGPLLVLLAACSQAPIPEAPAGLTPLFGTSGSDEARALASHDLGVYVAGHTSRNLHGSHKGSYDIFLRKEDEFGRLLWGVQFGTSSLDIAQGVAADPDFNAYVVGRTHGKLVGSHRGESDIFIRKIDPGGGHLWTRQLGTSGYDFANSVAVDRSGNAYVAAHVGSAVLYKFSSSGVLLWTRPYGSAVSSLNDVAVDGSGNVYVASSASRDMVLQKLDPEGIILWTRAVDYSSFDSGTAVAVSGSSVYLVGNYQFADLPEDSNVAVTKLTTDGVQLWSNAYGHYGQDNAWDASADRYGDLYFTGYTFTSFAGLNAGNYDGYVVKVSSTGTLTPLWSQTVGTPVGDYGFAVVARSIFSLNCLKRFPSSSCTQIYTAGYTFGSIPFVGNRGERDAYLRRLTSDTGGTVWTK